MINEGVYTPSATENTMYNSPWNIAANFEVDMSFSPAEIATMLAEYEADHNTGMDMQLIADEIYYYTNGYPFLVSRICQYIDTKLNKDWSLRGIHEAVQFLILEKNTLFDDIFKNMESNTDLRDFLFKLIFVGYKYEFNIYDPIIELGSLFGFLKADMYNKVQVANTIFSTLMYNYFVSKSLTSDKQPGLTEKMPATQAEKTPSSRISGVLQCDVVDGGRFGMEMCLRKFAEHYAEMFNERDAAFIEREGRLLFLSYLKPLINGQGYYHIESQLTDLRRMDIVVDFGQDQFVIELKLWKGESEHSKAYEQLAGYLASKGHTTGYLLTFDFRKGARQPPYTKWVEYAGKRIFDVVLNAAAAA